MKKFNFAAGVMLSAALCLSSNYAQAQCSSCGDSAVVSDGYVSDEFVSGDCASGGCGRSGKLRNATGQLARKAVTLPLGVSGVNSGAIFDQDGRTQPQTDCVGPRAALTFAATDHFSPNPVYAYSHAGLEAGQVHAWNQQQANVNSWHGGYNSWRYGQPTALVVPPTASYQSTYSWGVGQTRSTPIHHQFGRGAGSSGGSAGGYRNAPYFPWSTDQFGYYPVRGSW